jgi:3alpha(or 20beta)-hydroxysteroid dehydrogenase
MKRLKDKVAIITGGASGIGMAQAKLFVAEGAKIVVADLNDGAGRDLVKTLGASSLFVHHDVTSEDSWRDVVAKTSAEFGRVNVLVNNAGVYKPNPFQDTDQALLDLHYRVNVVGTFLGMKSVYPVMIQAGGGAIVNISSGAGMRGYAGMFAYSSSKWMVRGLSKNASLDLATSGIRVNTILPGLIDTPLLGENNSKDYIDGLKALVPAQRLGRPEEVAEAALYLASDASSFVMGAEITVCGGLMA